jgi:peroxiredoxin
MRPFARSLPLLIASALALPAADLVVGLAAPDFAVKDTSGRTIALAQLKGKVVVLEWTNPGCPFVQRHYQGGSLPALQRQAQAQGAVWITFNSTNSGHKDFRGAEALAKEYRDWKAAAAHLVLDPEGIVARAYQAKTTPHLFVIDATGKLAYMGAVDDDPRGNKDTRMDYVGLALTALKAGKVPAVTQTAPYGCSVKYK